MGRRPSSCHWRNGLAPLWHTTCLTWHHVWCQSGAMNLEQYVENINRQLALAA